MAEFNFNIPTQYDADAKVNFHKHAKKQLTLLALELGFLKDGIDLRSNKGGIAVSGEITLHHDKVYIQVQQSCMGGGILFRTCQGRKDYTGGHNNWVDNLNMLNDVPQLAALIKQRLRL